MTTALFLENSYLKRAEATVTGYTAEGGLILDQSIFYPRGGGQPGDSGRLEWPGGMVPVATAIKGEAGQIVLLASQPENLPAVGQTVMQFLDWDRRLRHMRVHTLLHLLSVAIPLQVTGGAISADKGRLDFAMPESAIDKDALHASLQSYVSLDLPVRESWITDAQLRADPGLVKTMSVAPPIGQGRVRLIGIGNTEDPVDLQPCGGTHVARTGEIGNITIGKIENKGRQNRRVNVLIDP